MGGAPAWDDVHGGELPASQVKEARKEEVDFIFSAAKPRSRHRASSKIEA